MLLAQITILGWIGYQDFKSRNIYWFLFPLLLLFGLISKTLSNELHWFQWLLSLSFVAFQVGIVMLYGRIKFKKWSLSNFESLMGWGDICFFVAMIPFFEFRQYLIVFTMGLMSSLLLQKLFDRIRKHKSQEIPLAGWLSIFTGLVLIIQRIGFVG
jgi:cytochrome c biogenesis protein CcdA